MMKIKMPFNYQEYHREYRNKNRDYYQQYARVFSQNNRQKMNDNSKNYAKLNKKQTKESILTIEYKPKTNYFS